MLDSGSVDAGRKKKTGKIKMMDVVNDDIQVLVTREEEVFLPKYMENPLWRPGWKKPKEEDENQLQLIKLVASEANIPS